MYYSEKALKMLAEDYAALNGKLDDLLVKFFTLTLTNPRAMEYARQGVPRRLKVLARCITNVFTGIPPERNELPSRDALPDATINIQSFVFNVFGAVDNLAWYGCIRTDKNVRTAHRSLTGISDMAPTTRASERRFRKSYGITLPAL
jgi:hypothetical protein